MAPKSNVPIRMCGSKVHTGCKTCKARHLKCDEGRPICLNCQKRDRRCSYEHSTASESRKLSEGPSAGISSYGPYAATEISAVKMFASVLGQELAGCFSAAVWCRVLPRVAQYEPSVWHGLVAISNLDVSLRLDSYGSTGDGKSKLALEHYSKAIQELHIRSSSADNPCRKDVILLSCLLFSIFESLQGNMRQALQHISGGTKLLQEWTNETSLDYEHSRGTYLDRKTLQPLFLALDSQAVQMGVVEFRYYTSLPAMKDQLHAFTNFTTAEDAHHVLNQIFNRMSHWLQWIEPVTATGAKPDISWMTAEQQRLHAAFIGWDAAFEHRLRLFPQPATLLLLLQKTCMRAFFERGVNGPSELAWDASLPLFRQAVEYAEAYMKFTAGELPPAVGSSDAYAQHSRGLKPTFVVAMDIVWSLVIITVKCRDAKLRRESLRMLHACNRKEGIWDSFQCAQVAKKIIELEESGALPDGYIPESARVIEMDPHLNDEKWASITYKKRVIDDNGCEIVEILKQRLAS